LFNTGAEIEVGATAQVAMEWYYMAMERDSGLKDFMSAKALIFLKRKITQGVIEEALILAIKDKYKLSQILLATKSSALELFTCDFSVFYVIYFDKET